MEFCKRGTYGTSLEDIQPHLAGVIENNDQLLSMVNALLEVYRHEAKRKKLTLVQLDLQDIAQRVIQQLRPLAQEKQLELMLKCSPQFLEQSSESPCMGDRIELSRVITNLVGNAIKFTKKGDIKVYLDYQPCEELDSSIDWHPKSSYYYLIEVSDTGIGISPQDLTTIFDWFRPGAHVNSGSGLGLHLSKRIVELHQGAIHVDSTLGVRTTFRVFLPASI